MVLWIKKINLSQSWELEGVEFVSEGVSPEEINSALWYKEVVGYESRIIGDSKHARGTLGCVVPLKTLFIGSLIYEVDYNHIISIESNTWNEIIMYKETHGYYGGTVKDITLNSDTIGPQYYQLGVLAEWPGYQMYLDGFEVEYAIDSYHYDQDGRSESPFIQ